MDSFFIDESGYTGYDLLNKQQPFQGASSIKIDEKSAKTLIKEYFPRNKSRELKHRSLSRRKNNWNALLEIQRALLNEYIGFTYVCNKKYLLTLMFLDSCVEPFFYDQGMDFYKDGQNYSLASLLYYTAPTFWGAENYEALLYLFQQAVKSKSDEAVLTLIEKAKSLLGRDLAENLVPLSIVHQGCVNEIKNQNSNTDAAFVVLLSLISHIEKHVSSEYEIVHDTSENLHRYNELIGWFVGMNTEKEFKQTGITTISFPLKLSGVSQQDSRYSYGIQLADLLIGGMIEHSMALVGLVEKTDYNQAVIGLYGATNIIHMLPSLNFEENKKFRAGTQSQEFIDFISKNIR